MDYAKLLVEISQYVTDYLDQNADKGLTYHNTQHAQYVAGSALKIARAIKLDQEDTFVLTAAAWLHDIGYIHGPENHEQRSSEMAKAYLSGLELPVALVEKISILILATRLGHHPSDCLEQVIRDADLFHLGTASFIAKNARLHKEEEFLKQKKISKKDWYEDSIRFLRSHEYATAFCQLSSVNRKQLNVLLLQSKLELLKRNGTENGNPESTEEATLKKRSSKEIVTFFQIASGNSQQLSHMADNKANILITVNSITISAIISFYLRRVNNDNYLFIPVFLILVVSLFSMICSILATRPKLPRGTFNQKELNHRQVNLLFFGNFYKMKIEKYTEGILTMIDDVEYLHSSLIKDVYFQGVVLGKKYFLLRLAYNTFMVGLILAVLSFAVLFLLHGHDPEIKGAPGI